MSIKQVKVNGKAYELADPEPPNNEHPHSEWLAITPETAENWLRVNKSNRTLRRRASQAQLRDMQAGHWQINGESIKFSRPLLKGEIDDLPEDYVLLLDGQHRLEACVNSRVPFVSLIVSGLEPEARHTMDTGISRTMSDVLKLDGKTNGTVVASVLRRIFMWRNGDYKFTGASRPTHAEMIELYEQDPHGFSRAGEIGYWVRTLFPDTAPAVVGTAYYLCNEIDDQQAPWFFARLRDGADLTAGHPVLALRARLQRERADKRHANPQHQLALILRAWNHYRSDTSITRLQQAPDDPMPMPK